MNIDRTTFFFSLIVVKLVNGFVGLSFKSFLYRLYYKFQKKNIQISLEDYVEKNLQRRNSRSPKKKIKRKEGRKLARGSIKKEEAKGHAKNFNRQHQL